MGSAFHQVSCGQEKEQQHYRGKIHDIPAVYYAAADAAVMRINAQHFYEIARTGFKNRKRTQCGKCRIDHEAGKGTEQE